MTNFLEEHWALSIFLTIILGAIGSGLWDIAFKPLGAKLVNVLFKVLTLNAKRSRDKVYLNAAMGHHELPSLYIFLLFIVLITAFVAASQFSIYKVVYDSSFNVEVVSQCNHEKAIEAIECNRKLLKQRIEPELYGATLMAIFYTVFIFYRFISINRTNLIVTYYQQCIKSIRPYISNEELYLIGQRFSLMTNKEEFDEILEILNAVAKGNNGNLPWSYINPKSSSNTDVANKPGS